jgi:hypothetical protein
MLQEQQGQEHHPGDTEDPKPTIDSLRELRRVLGRQQFDRLVWNSVVGNQVIVRGQEPSIVREIIGLLQVGDASTGIPFHEMSPLSNTWLNFFLPC